MTFVTTLTCIYVWYMYSIQLYVFICSIGYFGYDDIYKITANFEYGSESTAVPSPLTATILQSADKTRLRQTGKFLILPMSTHRLCHTL